MVNIKKNLTFQIAFSIICTFCLVLCLLYWLVLGAVSDFVQIEIKRDLIELEKELLYYCDRGAREWPLLSNDDSASDDPILIRTSTLRKIKEFSLRTNVEACVYDVRNNATILNTGLSPLIVERIKEAGGDKITPPSSSDFLSLAEGYYAVQFDFPRWGWKAAILRTESRYAGLRTMVRQAYIITLAIVVFCAVILALFLNRIIRKPIEAIVAPIREGRAPNYKGMDVFEFLSDNISGLIRSLGDSEEKYRLVVEHANDGIVIAQDGRIKFYNPKAMDLLGIEPGEFKSDLVVDYVHPLDREMIINKHIQRLSGHGSPLADSYTFRILDSFGKTKTVEISVVVINWKNKPATLNFLTDITEKKRWEESLRISERRSRAMLDAIPDVMFRMDRNGILLDYHSSDSVSGFEASRGICGQSIVEVFPDAAEKALKNSLDTLETGRTHAFEIEVNDKSGKGFFDIRMAPCGHDEVLAIVRDITKRKEADREIRQNERRYRALVENTFFGLFVSQAPTGKFLELNERFCDIFGYAMTEALEMTLWDVITPSEHAVISERGSARINGTYKGQESNVYTGVKKDGTEFRVEINASPVYHHGVLAMQGVVRDVTEKELMEKQLRQAQKMEAVGALASGIAHDFNNLIQVIQGYTELLLAGKFKSNGGQKELLEISQASQRASDMTRNLLTLGRKPDARLVPLDLNQEIRKTAGFLERIIPRMIRIELNLADDLPLINGNSTQIEQVLINLAVNARDAMPEGGRLILETETTYLGEEYSRSHIGAKSGTYVLLSASDTGCGMSAENVERIFEPFFSTKEAGKGAGLGLAMVYGIVKNHQGRILCYSEENIGTTFKIYLPITEARPEAPEPEEGQAPLVGGNETILLVDDEDSLRELGCEILMEYGYTVLTAEDGEQALMILESRPGVVDLVIMDLIMPGMGGRKAMKEILAGNPRQKIIVVSGYSANGPVRELIREGAGGFVGKPYRIKQLIGMVRSVLDGQSPE